MYLPMVGWLVQFDSYWDGPQQSQKEGSLREVLEAILMSLTLLISRPSTALHLFLDALLNRPGTSARTSLMDITMFPWKSYGGHRESSRPLSLVVYGYCVPCTDYIRPRSARDMDYLYHSTP